MRIQYIFVCILTAFPALAKWEACPSSCTPPAATTGLSVRLPLYAAPVRFGGDAKGNMWVWLKTTPTACTPAQLAERSDQVACAAPVGRPMFVTPRVRQSTKALRADGRAAIDPDAPFTRGTIRHCPMRLPDSSYSAEEREQCRVLDVLNGEVRKPD